MILCRLGAAFMEGLGSLGRRAAFAKRGSKSMSVRPRHADVRRSIPGDAEGGWLHVATLVRTGQWRDRLRIVWITARRGT